MYDFYSYEHVCAKCFLKFSKHFSIRNSSLDYLLRPEGLRIYQASLANVNNHNNYPKDLRRSPPVNVTY